MKPQNSFPFQILISYRLHNLIIIIVMLNITKFVKPRTRTILGNWRIVLTVDVVGQTETTFTVTE